MLRRNKAKLNKTEQNIRQLRLQILVAFVGIIFTVTMFLSFVVIHNSIETMKSKVLTLVSSNTYQQAMNVDAYLDRIRNTDSLFFSDELYYKYDATDSSGEEFDNIQSENAILSRIQDLGVLENYSDFGVVYANNHTVGWISTESYKLFGDGKMYDGFASKIVDTNTESGWFSDFNNNHNTIYYVKRLNPNAILFTSFYAREFESVFQVPDEMQGMHIRLIDGNSTVLYSNSRNEIGNSLDTAIQLLISDKADGSKFSNGYLVITNSCNKDKWRLVCSMPENIIMKEVYASRLFTVVFSSVLLIVVIILALAITKKISNPFGEMITSLADRAEHDLLTGMLNKISFRNVVTALLENSDDSDIYVFVMFDMDNFKAVNDTLGHDKGDEVLVRFADLIKEHFGQHIVKGRLGGDEFALFARYTDMDIDRVLNEVQLSLNFFRSDFRSEFKAENKSCKLSLSAGVSTSQKAAKDFDTLYKSADTALYSAKKDGKDKLNYY